MASPDAESPTAAIGVIGGSGFYRLLEGARRIEVDTPYGAPSDALTVGQVGGREVAFLPRHGEDHRWPPHRINYRANLWALRALGVRQVLAPCAVGSLRREVPPGSVVVPDQVVDRTTGRIQTFYDQGAVHVSFADPYCPTGRTALLKAAASGGIPARDGGTMVVVEGPRFSSRAESRWYADAGWSLVNMTGLPEASLARELGLCYASVALVTDYDAGVDADESVDQEEVFRVFAENTERLRGLLLEALTLLPDHRQCRCASALDGLPLPFDLP
ncbi:S-methyl-5'-thioadenosine phosphorylase [Streptacidiphilus sp. P02-A3a]|uniref:S-methyl-5'-thioadenosine phosphorylase n=1 Tax=Streptacidiphilus sp. P02-A3a TaxID=2704468 RepID=UPI0015FBAF23|nr:S-methyl-5'-thioadenosine phosphorylase [Streptacidiphilus sp. P02-A3a]QMU73237.1 S-methyl-5'-thioadenosine phosphorylase [Streptacidiphilus sp. P02-A3a]